MLFFVSFLTLFFVQEMPAENISILEHDDAFEVEEMSSIQEVLFLENDVIAVLGELNGNSVLAIYEDDNCIAHTVFTGSASTICMYSSEVEDEECIVAIESRDGTAYLKLFPLDDIDDSGLIHTKEVRLPFERTPKAVYQVDDDSFVMVCGSVDENNTSAGYTVGLVQMPSEWSTDILLSDSVVYVSRDFSRIFWEQYSSYSSLEELYSILLDVPEIAVISEANRLFLAPPSRESYDLKCFDIDRNMLIYELSSELNDRDNPVIVNRDHTATELDVSVMDIGWGEYKAAVTEAIAVTSNLDNWEPDFMRRMVSNISVSHSGEVWIQRGTCQCFTLDRFSADGEYLGSYELTPEIEGMADAWQLSSSVFDHKHISIFSIFAEENKIFIVKED